MQEFALLAVVLLLGMAAYYSMVIFPKQRDFQKRQRFVRTISAGDEVVTFGGVIGKVVAMDAETGTTQLEIADNVIIKVLTAALMQTYTPQRSPAEMQKGAQQEDQTIREG